MGHLAASYFPPMIQSDLLSRGSGVEGSGGVGRGHRVCYVCEEVLESRRKLMRTPERRQLEEGDVMSSGSFEDDSDSGRGSWVGGVRASLSSRFGSWVGGGGDEELEENKTGNYMDDESDEGASVSKKRTSL